MSKYIFASSSPKHCYDVAHGSPDGNEFCYRVFGGSGTNSSAFCFTIWDSSSAYYSTECFSSHNIFACTGVRRKKNCVLNKCYSTKDYQKIVKKIVSHMVETGEWGEYLDESLSCFAYNESVANEYFPLEKVDATNLGYRWNDNMPSQALPKHQKFSKIPSSLSDFTKENLNDIYRCKETGKAFKFTLQEFTYLKEAGLPLPYLCPDSRHLRRIKNYPFIEFKKRNCYITKKEVFTPLIDPSVKVISPEAFLEFDYTNVPKEHHLAFSIDDFEKFDKSDLSVDNSSNLFSLDNIFEDFKFSDFLDSLSCRGPEEFIRNQFAKKMINELLKSIEIGVEKELISLDILKLSSSKSLLKNVLFNYCSYEFKLNYYCFDDSEASYLNSFILGFLDNESQIFRPSHPGPLFEKVFILSSAMWQVLIEVKNSDKENTTSKDSLLSIVGSPEILREQILKLESLEFLIESEKVSTRYVLSDLGSLVFNILHIGVKNHG